MSAALNTTASSVRAVIAELPGTDPDRDRHFFTHGDRLTLLILVPDAGRVVGVARELADAGFSRIELCGGLGATWQAKVIDAVGDRARVGAVLYGFESLVQAADFKTRFADGESLGTLFLILQPGSDPDRDRVETPGRAPLLTVAVPDADTAARVARQSVERGTRLIELYGDFAPASAARVIDAVEERVPVGVVGYGTDVVH